MAWDPKLHPRVPGGPHGGEFLSTSASLLRVGDEFIHPETGKHHTITRATSAGDHVIVSYGSGGMHMFRADQQVSSHRVGDWASEVANRMVPSAMSLSAIAPRPEFEAATTTRELEAATKAELQRVTGQKVKVSWRGMHLEVAKHHAEGILRGAEAFPDVRIGGIDTFKGKSGDMRVAHTFIVPGSANGADMYFNSNDLEGNPYTLASFTEVHNRMHRAGHLSGPLGDLTHAGSHEFGHVVAASARWDRPRGLAGLMSSDSGGSWVGTIARKSVDRAGVDVGRAIGLYATGDNNELWGELFADYIARGAEAHPVSRHAVAAVKRGWQELKL